MHRDQKETAGTIINQRIQEIRLRFEPQELYKQQHMANKLKSKLLKKYVTTDSKMKRSVKGLDILKSIISNGFPKKLLFTTVFISLKEGG